MAKQKSRPEAGRSRVIGVSLIEVDIKQSATNEEKEAESEFQYSAEIGGLEIIDPDLVVFSAIFGLRKSYPNESDDVTRISAKYYCGVRGASTGDAADVARGFAATTVWSSFSSLCAIVTQQMGTSFPLLPPAPDRVTIPSGEEAS